MAVELAPTADIEAPFGIQIPLKIAPAHSHPKALSRGQDSHHLIFDSEDERIKTDYRVLQAAGDILDEKRASRWSAVLYGSRWAHGRYHDFYPEGIWMPENEDQNFALAFYLSARYVADWAVDVQSRSPRLVSVNSEMREELRDNLYQQHDRHWAIGYFFARYILRHGLEDITDSETVTRFLEAGNEYKIRRKLGYKVVNEAMDVALEPIEPFYQAARAKGNISSDMPATARGFLLRHFDNRQPDYFDTIEAKLLEVA